MPLFYWQLPHLHKYPASKERYRRSTCGGCSESAGNMWSTCRVHFWTHRSIGNFIFLPVTTEFLSTRLRSQDLSCVQLLAHCSTDLLSVLHKSPILYHVTHNACLKLPTLPRCHELKQILMWCFKILLHYTENTNR